MFEWDETKRLLNLNKHGIDFQIATRVFDGRQTVEVQRWIEERRAL